MPRFGCGCHHLEAAKHRFEILPKHGSWLNAVEIEFAVLSRQCLDRRIDSMERLRSEVEAWSRKRNQKRVGVKWRFTTDDARRKLPCLYPKISSNPS
ncbi:transposase [Deinococcus alpinitundrae]|uniref:transposase n=1 Tax=Deinococcus alpinitundrae TaxID=468913 RepID=UPI00137A261C|nr:transposase [Deinococcus alpinitundrae]